MGNPIMNFMSQKIMANNPQMQRLSAFKQFANSMQGKDPQAILREMVSNGKLTSDQLEQAKSMATQFANQLNK